MLELLRQAGNHAGYVLIFGLLLLGGYRIFLHPLRGYPGPALAKVTGWYSGFHAIKKRLHLKVLEDHRKYGSVIRIAPDGLLFDTSTAFRVIYQSDQLIKSYTYRSGSKDFKVNLFTERDPDAHRVKRKLIGQAVTERSMRSFEPTMIEQIDIYLRQVLEASQMSKPVNMTEKARHLAIDIVGQLAFGYGLGVQTRQENRFVISAISFGLYRMNIFHHLHFLTKFEPTFVTNYLARDSRERYWRLLQTMIRTRMAQEKHARADLYSFIADALDAEPDTLNSGSMWTEALFFMAAGGDTVSTLNSAALFYLSRNPQCYEKLAREIRSNFTSSRDIKGGPRLAGCAYLRACIDETLRMSPSLSSVQWREQDPKDTRPLVVDGYVIPPGTLVAVTPYAIQHNEAYFPDPFTFQPDRWLEQPGNSEARKIAYDAFAPFSIGPRNCGGKAMAYLESSLMIAKTLWYFDFETAPGELGKIGGGKPGAKYGRDRPGEYQLFDNFTSTHDGPYLVFHPRGNMCQEDLGPTA